MRSAAGRPSISSTAERALAAARSARARPIASGLDRFETRPASLARARATSGDGIRRRLGLRRAELGASDTFGVAWPAWLAWKKKLRPSSARALRGHGGNWLLPVLADIPVDRVSGEHCAMVFERIDLFNEEIEAAREEKRAPVLPGDVRQLHRYVGVASQHRVYAALREFFNYHLRKAHTITFNPVYAVELEAETRDPVTVWTPEQVGHFLDFHDGDRMYWL